eukprot:c13388_g1_i1.p1 GENE.c13388_g1_i1~~c13388_g1_i1.p1  ORF type:complete len:318 (+),score=52.95 c13388_g1_i1:22-975(+)
MSLVEGNPSEIKFPTQKHRPISAIRWNCTGSRLATVSSESKYARIWAVDSHSKDPTELRGHESLINSVAWDPKRQDQIVTCSTDKTIRIWDTRTSKSQATIETDGQVFCIDWSKDSSIVATGSRFQQDDYISTWDIRKRKLIKNFKFPFEVHSLSFGTNGSATNTENLLYACTGAGVVLVFRGANLTPVCQIQAHVSRTYCIDVHPSNRYIATGGADAMVNVWDMEFQVSIATVPRLASPTNTISFSHDGNILASGSTEGKVDMADTFTGEHLKTLVLPRFKLSAVAFHPSRLVLAVAGEDENEPAGGAVNLYSWNS